MGEKKKKAQRIWYQMKLSTEKPHHRALHHKRQAPRFISFFCTHSQWSIVQLLVHSPPAMGFASKGSIKYIIKILLHGESGKAAELYIFYQVIRFSIHSCSTVFKSFSTKDLASFRRALPTGKIFAQRIPELQAATIALVFKHFRIYSSKYPLLILLSN